MAVAPVAVEMGPRNQRRLTASAITLAAVLVIVTSGLWFFGGLPFTHSANHADSTVTPRHLTLVTDSLVYGMSRQQVAHKIGQPEKVAGGCWQYPENKMDFVGQKINAVRVCFLGNAYSNDYVQLDGKWRLPGTTKIVIAPPTQ
jgi:hypothetical protein